MARWRDDDGGAGRCARARHPAGLEVGADEPGVLYDGWAHRVVLPLDVVTGPSVDLAGIDVERARLAALARYDVLDSAPERAFDDLCELAAHVCGTPTALISLVDEGRQWFKARVGMDVCATDRGVAFCAHALTGDGLLVVPDATADPRFRDNPMVTGPPGIRFYAGAPLITADGFTLGTMCVVDTVPRRLSRRQEDLLQALARQVMTQLEHRLHVQALALEVAERSVSQASQDQTRRVHDAETQARAEMFESERRWKNLAEDSPVAVAVCGTTDLLFRYANETATRLVAASTTQELIGRSFLDILTESHRSATLQRLARVLGGETVPAAEVAIRGLDGRPREVEIETALVTWNGERAVEVTMRDISARVAADRPLRASEDRFRVLFDTAPVGMVESLPDGTLLAANPAFCAMLGYQEHELIGRPLLTVVDPDDHEPMSAALAQVLTQDRPTSSTVQRIYRHRDGSAVTVLLVVNSVWDADGRALRSVATFVDITARVAAEDKLREYAVELSRRQAFSEAILDSVQVGIVACDAAGHLTTFNNAARTWHGVDVDAHLDQTEFARHYDLFQVDGLTPLPVDQIPLLVALREGAVRNAEMVIAPEARAATRVLCTGQVMLDEHGVTQGAVIAMHDITALRADEQRLREHVAFHDGVLAASPDLIYVLDPVAGRDLWSSGNLLDMLGYTQGQVEAFDADMYASLVHPEDEPRLRASNVAAGDLDDGQVITMRYRAKAADGGYRWLARRATPFKRDSDGQLIELLAIARDITELVEVEERLTQAALHDPLTGLPNRTLLTDRLSLALDRTARTDTHVAILFCDLDGFKSVNDTSGHAAGDAVLAATADRLRGVVRPQDTVARVGGDEFVVILEPAVRDPERTSGDGRRTEADAAARPEAGDTDSAARYHPDAVDVVRRIKAALAEPVTAGDAEHVVTVSIGVTFARAGDEPDEVLRDADSAMYQAKNRGKDRHVVFSPDLRVDAAERGRVKQVLRAALQGLSDPTPPGARGGRSDGPPGVPRLTLAYQPIFELATRRLAGVEALARLSDADGLPISPDVFIPVAEDTGLIAPLGRHVLATACADLAAWHAAYPAHRSLGMSVNLSAREAGLADLVQQVHDTLEETRIAPHHLTLELTESVLLEAGRSTTTALRSLREMGVGVSIDDFGTGYASLRYLTELPVTGVKVDRSFTQGLPADPTSVSIVTAVSTLASQLGLSCVVEGIETRDQLRALPPGVLGQGYLLGRPQPADAVERLLAGLTDQGAPRA